ncbi:MAG: hypothetical protein ACLT5P_04700 [Flavonifractor plautii]
MEKQTGASNYASPAHLLRPFLAPCLGTGLFYRPLCRILPEHTKNLGQKIYFAIQSEVIAAGLFEQ